MRGSRLARWPRCLRDVVPPRPAPGATTRPCSRRAPTTTSSLCSCSTPPSGARPATSRRAYLAASLRSLDASLRQRRTRLSVVRRAIPDAGSLLAARAVGAERVHVAADYGPYGRRRDDAVERRWPSTAIELVRTGSPYAVAPGRVDQPARATRTRSSRRSPGPGPSTAGAARSTPRPARAGWSSRTTAPTCPSPRSPTGIDAARGRRGRGAATLAGVPRRPASPPTTTTATGPASTAPPGCRCT